MLMFVGTIRTRIARRAFTHAGFGCPPHSCTRRNGIGRQSPLINVVDTPTPSTNEGSSSFARMSVIGLGSSTGGQPSPQSTPIDTHAEKRRHALLIAVVRVIGEELQKIS